MERMDEFLRKLSMSEPVERLRAMKAKIESDPDYFSRFQDILALQRKLVQEESKTAPEYLEKYSSEYDSALSALKQDVLIHEYLSELEDFQNLLHDIESILNSTLSE